ncbi:MAG: DcrB-related protein [Acetobacteraceae bacterium]|nr:DcrB-related protein [Acetobacteraceae bacterium]
MSPVVADGLRVRVSSATPLSVWLPSDWEVVDGQLFELLALGPPEAEDPYRANVSIVHASIDGAPSLEAIAEGTARKQAEQLETFVEYERRPTVLAGLPAVQREYGWVQGGTGLVLYQVEVLALPAEGDRARMLEVHATSAAPAYFRYAALLRHIIESIEPAREA